MHVSPFLNSIIILFIFQSNPDAACMLHVNLYFKNENQNMYGSKVACTFKFCTHIFLFAMRGPTDPCIFQLKSNVMQRNCNTKLYLFTNVEKKLLAQYHDGSSRRDSFYFIPIPDETKVPFDFRDFFKSLSH